jgi:hypothetical protein
MKDLILQKYIYYASIYNQSLKLMKEIFIYLLIMFILGFYYYMCMHAYNFINHNDQLTTICIISIEELKPVNINQPKIWYKYFFDDFLNIFTSNGKAINYKILEVKSDIKTLMPLELEHNLSMMKKPIILNKIQYNTLKSIISECEYYKNKTSLLEIQLLQTKIAYHNLIKDIDNITKEMPYSLKKP